MSDCRIDAATAAHIAESAIGRMLTRQEAPTLPLRRDLPGLLLGAKDGWPQIASRFGSALTTKVEAEAHEGTGTEKGRTAAAGGAAA